MEAKYNKYPVYKDSGVEWLGEIPESWEIGKLGSILKPISIKNKSDLQLLSITREKGVIVRNIEDDNENHNFIPDDLSNYKLIERGQFGMNKMKAWQGSYGVSNNTGIVSPAYYVFKFSTNIDPEFFNLAIRSKRYVTFFGQASDGVRIGQWDLSKSRMKQIPFIIPSKSEQKSIVNHLDQKTKKVDQAIAQKEQMIALLKERKQIMIQELVTGKKVWNKETQSWTKPNQVKDSGVEWIGEIPVEWEVKKLKHCISKKIDNRGRTPIFGNNGIPMLEVKNITDGIGSPTLEFTKFVLPEIVVRYERDKVEIGDLLISTVGATSGKVVIIKENPNFFICQNVVGLRTNKLLLSKFTSYALNSLYFKTSLMLINKGNTIDNLKVSIFINNIIILPTQIEQVEIVSYIEAQSTKIDKAIAIQKKQIERLKEYKMVLIDSLVTGKVRIN